MLDRFFDKNTCDRCGEKLGVRTMSWFTNECIGMKCMEEEEKIKDAIRKAGKRVSDFEGIGRIPRELLKA